MDISPSFDAFARNWRAGKNQTVWTRLVSDMETPVSAMLKLGRASLTAFLLESIEGGAVRGRYSIIGREPDLIWRCDRDGKVRINRAALTDAKAYASSKHAPLEDLRALLDGMQDRRPRSAAADGGRPVRLSRLRDGALYGASA